MTMAPPTPTVTPMTVFFVSPDMLGLLGSDSFVTSVEPVVVLVVWLSKVVCCPFESVCVITMTSVMAEVNSDNVVCTVSSAGGTDVAVVGLD